ncbi:hypothetical protein FQA39_LY18936 [Lamprigera yunnana]|nr:hypothetical protein FQA39_LY18936 [Lamprigera yunnana]
MKVVMVNSWFIWVWGLFPLCSCIYQKPLVTPVFEWVHVDFDYPSNEAREIAIANKQFIVGVPRPGDVDVYYDENEVPKYFLAFPRINPGVPIALGLLTNKTYNGNPVVAPYPSWNCHGNISNCSEDRIYSVFRIKTNVIVCGFLDTGPIRSARTCPIQILAFDLKTNKLLHRYNIPDSQVQSNSVFNVPVVDVRDTKTCKGTFVYVSDTRGFALIVYDVDNDVSWKIADKTMQANSDFGTLCINGVSSDLMDGLLSMGLSPYKNGEDRVLFYNALASNSQQYVWTSQLRNRTAFLTNASPNPNMFHMFCGRRNTQSSPMGIDKNGIGLLWINGDASLNCWATSAPYGPSSIQQLYQNFTTLQYISGMKVVTRRNGDEEIWFVNTRLGWIANGPSNAEINFRIQNCQNKRIWTNMQKRGGKYKMRRPL